MTALKWIAAALIAIGSVLGAYAFFTAHSTVSFGQTGNAPETHPNGAWYVGGLQTGPTGTWDANTQFGTCNPTYYGTSLAATSTGTFVCTVQGINAGDFIFPDMPKTSAGTFAGFIVENAYSTTTNVVAFTILNLTGAATSSFAQATTGIEYATYR